MAWVRIKEILLLFMLLTTYQAQSRELTVTLPKITVPNFMPPTELVFKGKVKFKNNWVDKIFGAQALSQMKLLMYFGTMKLGKARFTSKIGDTYDWDLTINLLSGEIAREISLDMIERLKNGQYNLVFVNGDSRSPLVGTDPKAKAK